MKKILFLLYLIVGSMLYAITEDCNMHVDMVKNSNTQFIVTLTHDKECNISMEHKVNNITLVSKKYINNTSKPTKKTEIKIDKLISLAQSKIGSSYQYAKAGPNHFDCSGFVYYLFKTNNIKIPRTSLNQSKDGKKITREGLKKGDILFFDTSNKKHVNHSGVYLGDGKFIHSSSGKAYGVTISNLDKGFYPDKFRWGIRKIEDN